MRKLLGQIMKFGVVGGIATVIDFSVMIFLTEVFGIDPVISSAISFCVSLAFNYIASMCYVFERRGDVSRMREFLIFLALSIVGLGLNSALMWVGTNRTPLDYRLVKVGATSVVMVWNFMSRKVFLEKRH